MWRSGAWCQYGHWPLYINFTIQEIYPDSKVHGANMGPTWVLSAPIGPHVGPMNLAIRVNTVATVSANVLSPNGVGRSTGATTNDLYSVSLPFNSCSLSRRHFFFKMADEIPWHHAALDSWDSYVITCLENYWLSRVHRFQFVFTRIYFIAIWTLRTCTLVL